ncbi:MAG: hypothetical protein SOV83_02305, partial [Prevotella sp.]|nr:hypothetical protein [Prevotella sp.]
NETLASTDFSVASVVCTENPTKSINPLILTDFSSFCPHSQFFVVSLPQKRTGNCTVRSNG